MMKNKFVIALCLLGTIVFSGCDKEEKIPNGYYGYQTPIALTVNGIACDSHTLTVPPEGGEYKIFSSNYGSLWLSSIYVNKEIVWPEYPEFDTSGCKDIHLTGEWYEVQYDDNGNIVVNISSKEQSTESRKISINVGEMNASAGVSFVQE